MRIRFDKVDGKIEHLILFDYGLFNKIRDKIKHLMNLKVVLQKSINHSFGKARIDSFNYLPIKKIMTFHNVIMIIKSVVNKNNK